MNTQKLELSLTWVVVAVLIVALNAYLLYETLRGN